MNTNGIRNLGVMICACTLAGCMASSEDPAVQRAATLTKCTYLTGAKASSSVDSSCFGCSAADEAKSIDGDLTTFATMSLGTAENAGAAIRADGPADKPYAAGNKASVLMEIDQGGSSLNLQYSLTTFLAGQQQEQKAASGDAAGTGQVVVSIDTTKDFDALEARVTGTYSGISAKVYEFCSDSQTEDAKPAP